MKKIQDEFIQPSFDKLIMTICHPAFVEGWLIAQDMPVERGINASE